MNVKIIINLILYLKNYGTLTLGSDKTERIIIKNNSIEGGNDVCLFYNPYSFSTTINSKNIIDISNNILSSKEENSYLFYNYGTLTLGSDKTETIRIEGNNIEGKNYNSLLFNITESTLNINGSNISIKNNTISGDENENYYAIYNYGIININLYGNKPIFKMSGNRAAEADKKLTADIYLDDIDSELNFINNSNKKAIIKLGNCIGDKGFVTFKNSENNKNGSFKVENTYIEANEINIESNVTLLLTINSEGLLGGLKGSGNNPKLNISDGKQLTIEVVNTIKDDKPQESYTIISGFKDLKGLTDSKKIVLVNEQQIEINGIKYEFLIKEDEIMLKSENKDKKATKKKAKKSPKKLELETKTDRQREILRLIEDIKSYKVVSDLLSNDYISDNNKLSLLDDIAPLSVKEITYQVNNNMLNNVLNVINERLLSYSSLIVSDNNNNNMLLLLASNNNNDNNYKDIIRLKERRNNTYELWSKISYNYGHDFNNSNNNNNIHTIGITLGMDYNINNDKYKLGLSYSFNMSNGKEIISNIISSYGKINNINNNNYFLNFIINYGRMNVDISKNNSKHMNVNHTYIMNVISFNTTFGKEIKINNNNNNNDNNNNIIIPKMSLGYNHISRNNYEIKNIDIKVNNDLHINVL